MKREKNRDALLSVLKYRDDGRLVWSVRSGSAVVGKVAGGLTGRGYLSIGYRGLREYAHRIVWRIHTGRWPEFDIDHIDGNKENNRIENLREVSRTKNMQNMRSATSRNKTGLLGVFPRCGRFASQIRVDGKKITVGTFDSAVEAHEAYLVAKRRLHDGCTI